MVETLRPKFGQDFEAKFSLTRSMTLKQLLWQYFFNFSPEDKSCLSENDKYDQAGTTCGAFSPELFPHNSYVKFFVTFATKVL